MLTRSMPPRLARLGCQPLALRTPLLLRTLAAKADRKAGKKAAQALKLTRALQQEEAQAADEQIEAIASDRGEVPGAAKRLRAMARRAGNVADRSVVAGTSSAKMMALILVRAISLRQLEVPTEDGVEVQGEEEQGEGEVMVEQEP